MSLGGSPSIESSLETVARFRGNDLTNQIWQYEASLTGANSKLAGELCDRLGIGSELLRAAVLVKRESAQISVVIHAAGIIAALPKILEDGETVVSLSIGAGNTGKKFDLETTERIAEFKFIEWQGHDTIRQNNLFKDFFELAEEDTALKRELYVIDPTHPLKFLHGGRALKSVLSKNRAVDDRFRALYGDRFQRVCDYFQFRKDRVRLVDLRAMLPSLI